MQNCMLVAWAKALTLAGVVTTPERIARDMNVDPFQVVSDQPAPLCFRSVSIDEMTDYAVAWSVHPVFIQFNPEVHHHTINYRWRRYCAHPLICYRFKQIPHAECCPNTIETWLDPQWEAAHVLLGK